MQREWNVGGPQSGESFAKYGEECIAYKRHMQGNSCKATLLEHVNCLAGV